jgi:hypothetical protein
MGLSHRQLDPKTRRLLAIGNLCLAAGLLLWNFARPSSKIEQDWLHGVCGMLLGISIGINLFGLRFARRCREKQI